MTAAVTAARRVSLRTEATAWALTLLAWLWAALLHQGLGPPRGRAEWLFSQPSGFLLEWLASSSFAPLGEDVRLGVALLTAPAAALALAVALVTRSALPRLLAQSLNNSVECLPQLIHEPLDFLVTGAFGQRSREFLLGGAQITFGNRQITILDSESNVPQMVDCTE